MRPQQDISEYSEDELYIVDHLISGRNEIDSKKAKIFFTQALNKSNDILKTSKIAYGLYLEGLFELADIEYNIKERTFLWDKLCKKVLEFLNVDSQNEEIIIHCSDIVISYIHEQYIQKDFALIKRLLTILRGKIDSLIKYKGVSNSPGLLITKASIIRALSLFQTTIESEKTMIEEAIRCVEKSISIDNNAWFSYLELGNCYWRNSNFEKKLEYYNDKILLVEDAYLKSQEIKLTIQNTLSLCKLYKETYQTAPFLTAFKTYESIEKNKRRYLQNSYILAETTIRMFYSNFPSELLLEYLLASDRLLNEAIVAGYSNARIIINLAFIKAIKGELSVGTYVLKALRMNKADSFDWTLIVQELELFKESNDLFSQGFVLGIDDASVWNSLGTFASTFLGDRDLALKMYRVALRFNPSNPIASTNLARTLIKELNEDNLKEAEYHISKAASASTFRFQWWRGVRDDVEQGKKYLLNIEEPRRSSKSNFNFSKVADLYKFYLSLKELNSPQERGYEFEKLIASYFRLSLGNSISSHRIKSITTNDQIDAAFFFEKFFYRVEAKWTKYAVDHTDINNFYFKIKTVGVRGLFISVNGFTPSAVERARTLKDEVQLLLMDGEEIETTLKGTIPLDEAIRLKQLYFYKQDNPYHNISLIKNLTFDP